jgi:hypothetical protein
VLNVAVFAANVGCRARGPQGEPGLAAPSITAWKIDRERYRAVPFYADGKSGPAIELRDFSRSFSTKLHGASDGRSASPRRNGHHNRGRTRYARLRRVRVPIAFNVLNISIENIE